MVRPRYQDTQRQITRVLEQPHVLPLAAQPLDELIAPCRMHSGNNPRATSSRPQFQLPPPGGRLIGRQRTSFAHSIGTAQPPFDAAVAHIDDDICSHDAASTCAACNCSTTARTRSAKPCPVTADSASTGRPNSSSKRRRTSALPVSSALLTATISGLRSEE